MAFSWRFLEGSISSSSGSATGRFCQALHAHWLHEEAAACYEIAHTLAPQDFRWVYLLAGVEEIRGADGERVLRLFREAIRLAPGFPPLRVRYADALLRLGRWAEAREAYQAAADGPASEVAPVLKQVYNETTHTVVRPALQCLLWTWYGQHFGT